MALKIVKLVYKSENGQTLYLSAEKKKNLKEDVCFLSTEVIWVRTRKKTALGRIGKNGLNKEFVENTKKIF